MINKIIRLIMFLVVSMLVFNMTKAQTKRESTMSGFVHDKKNGEAMIGVNLYIKDIGRGGSTNSSGYFVINNIPFGKYNMAVSFIGYQTGNITIIVNSQNMKPLNIELTPGSVQLSEIVVSDKNDKLIDKLYAAPVSKFEMTGMEVNKIPRVIEADLLRSLQTMPGITALSDFSSALYVRGGTPDQNLYLIDGADVYNPEHAFGIFSTFNTNAIKKVDVSKGGFSSEYGGRLSSVIDITNLDGNRNKSEGMLNMSLLSGSTTLQIPMGNIGSLSGSFRRTYVDQTYSKWIKEVPDYYFYDGNLKGFFDISENDKLSVSYFNSQDNLNYKVDKNSPDSFGFLYNWGNTTGSANWKHIFSQKLFASFWLTGSQFDSKFKFDKILNMREDNNLNDFALKASLEYFFSNELKFKLGGEQKFLYFLYKFNWDNGRVDISQKSRLSNAYIDANWTPDILWDINAGARLEHFNADKNYTDIEPRFSVKYRLTESSNVKFAAGIYHQYLDRVPRLFFSSIWASADKYIQPSSAKHYIISYQKQIADIVQMEAEVYYKNYSNIYIFNQNMNTNVKPGFYDNAGNPLYNTTEGIFTRGDGHSIGFELLLRKDIGAISGWISYSLSNTANTFDGINQGNEFAPRHDRSSVINMVINGDIGSLFSGNWNQEPEKSSSKWLFGINFVYATGQPITVPSSAYYVNTLPEGHNNNLEGEGAAGYKLYPGSIDSYRLPAYIRMDLSVTYEKDYGGWTLSPYIQVFNIGNRKNAWFINYKNEVNGNTIIQTAEKVNMLPLLPSIGVTVKF